MTTTPPDLVRLVALAREGDDAAATEALRQLERAERHDEAAELAGELARMDKPGVGAWARGQLRSAERLAEAGERRARAAQMANVARLLVRRSERPGVADYSHRMGSVFGLYVDALRAVLPHAWLPWLLQAWLAEPPAFGGARAGFTDGNAAAALDCENDRSGHRLRVLVSSDVLDRFTIDGPSWGRRGAPDSLDMAWGCCPDLPALEADPTATLLEAAIVSLRHAGSVVNYHDRDLAGRLRSWAEVLEQRPRAWFALDLSAIRAAGHHGRSAAEHTQRAVCALMALRCMRRHWPAIVRDAFAEVGGDLELTDDALAELVSLDAWPPIDPRTVVELAVGVVSDEFGRAVDARAIRAAADIELEARAEPE